MRTGAIFARGSCRALKWMALFGVVFALGVGSAVAQVTVTGPARNTVTEGDTATYTVSVKGYIPADTATPTAASVELATVTGVAQGTTTAGESGDLSTATQSPRTVTFALPANNTDAAVTHTATGTISLQTLHDDDAEDERFTFTASLTAGDLDEDADGTDATLADGAPTMLVIDDDEIQKYVLELVTGQTLTEGDVASVTLKAMPDHVNTSLALTLHSSDPVNYLWDNDNDLSTGNVDPPATIAIGPTDATPAGVGNSTTIYVKAPDNDENRETDTVTLTAYSGSAGGATDVASEDISFADDHVLAPAEAITAVAMDKKTDGEEVDSVVEGGDPVYLTISVDRGKAADKDATTVEKLTVDVQVAPEYAADASVTPARVELAAVTTANGEQKSEMLVELSALSDEDVGMEEVMLNLTMMGQTANGAGNSVGTFSIMIVDGTVAKIAPRSPDEAYPKIEAAIEAGGGDDGLNPGESFELMTADLFTVMDGYTTSYAASVEGDSISASTSGGVVTVNAMQAGTSKITITGTASEGSSSFQPSQSISNVAEVMFEVEVVDSMLVVTVAADPMEIMEGGTSTITATANRAITAGDRDVMIGLNVIGDGMLDSESIVIAMGDMSGSAMLTATEDDDYDDETVTVVASGSGITGTMQVPVSVMDNDEMPAPTNVVIAKSSDDIYPLIMAAGLAGDDAMFNPGMSAGLDASMMFDLMDGYSASYGAESDAMNVASTSVSGSMVTVTAAEAGMAHVVITATATMASGVMPGQPATNVATVMFPVNVVNMPLAVTVSTDPMDMVEEGGMITVTAMANRMVLADDGDVEVMLTITGAVEMNEMMISIAAGMDSGTAMIQVLDDMEVAPLAAITIVATGSGIATPQTATIAVTEDDSPRTFTLMASDDMMQLVEGGDGVELTVTADPAVSVDTEVTIMVDRAASTADADDFTAAPITIMAGEASGTTMLMATEDMMDDSGHASPEMLVVFAMADNTQSNTVSFYIWDMAVPALPLIAQLLLAAFLAIGGYRRYLRR